MDNLLKYLPGKLIIAIAGREAPDINISRLISNGAALEITTEDLGFTYEEFSEHMRNGGIFNQAVGCNAAADMLESLYGKCEGWPLALGIARELLLKKSGPPEESFFMEFHDKLSGFFVRELMDRLPEECQNFLTATSVLDSLSPEACKFLTGREDAEELLEYMRKHNLFLRRRHESGKSYVYHRPFREFLFQRLGKRQSAFFAKTGEFYFNTGKYDEAVECFIRAGDGENTLKALKKAAIPVFCGESPDKTERWLLSCRSILSSHTEWLELLEGAVCLCKGLLKESERLVKDAYEKFSAGTDKKGRCLALIVLSKIQAYRGDFEGSIILSDYAVAGAEPMDDALYYNMIVQKAFNLSIKGEFDSVILTVEAGAELLVRHGSKTLSALVQRFLAVPYYFKGDYKRAFYYYDMAKGMVEKQSPQNDQLLVDLLISRAYRDIGEYKKSRELFEKTISLEKELRCSENLYVTYYHYSLLFSDSGDYEEALHYICLAEELAVNGGVDRWFLDVAAGHKSFMLSKCGRLEEGLVVARRLLEQIGEAGHFLFSGALFYAGFTFLQNSEYQNAERCMLKALSISKSAGFKIIECYSSGMLSHLYSQSAYDGPAEEYAKNCLELAAAGGYLQGFISIPQMLDCVKAGILKGCRPEFLSRVLGKLDRTSLFRSVIDSMKVFFFTRTPQQRSNIFDMLGRLYETGFVSGIPKIFICTFENMKIYVTGKGIDTGNWRTNKARELFAYLLNKRGAAVSSEKLITELWPGSPPDKAKSLLYANIVYIKSRLGQWGLSDSLRKVQNGYLIGEDEIFCDKWLVDDEIERHRSRRGEACPEWLFDILNNRIFMDGIYSDWVLDEQNKLGIVIDEGA